MKKGTDLRPKLILIVGILLVAYWLFTVYSRVNPDDYNQDIVVNIVEPRSVAQSETTSSDIKDSSAEETVISEDTEESPADETVISEDIVETPAEETVISEDIVETPVANVYRFRNAKLLKQHYEKHGIEMGFASEEEYEKAASDVINDPRALTKTEAEDGDFVYYIEETNEFVILSTDGFIRTYFCPSGGKAYFDRQ